MTLAKIVVWSIAPNLIRCQAQEHPVAPSVDLTMAVRVALKCLKERTLNSKIAS